MIALALYGALTGLFEPFAPLALKARARRGKEEPARLGERLGRTSRPRPPGPLVWLHGVSVGESVSLLPLVEALQAARPGVSILVTSGTVTSAQVLAKRLPAGVIHQYAPVDAPGAVGRFLDHWRPEAAIFVESELWPNLITAARRRGVKLALLSARMTEASARGWRRAPGAARALLSAFDLVMAQDAATAERLSALGAQLGEPLNLKRLGQALAAHPPELTRLRDGLEGRRIVLAASTHPGEERLIVDALAGLDALLILAPRHPERGAALAAEFGAPRRSAGTLPTGGTRIYLADTLGELGLFFRLADVTIMGGAFVQGVGGHNPLEPARCGAAIVTGPHVFNAADLYAEMTSERAAVQVADAAELRRVVEALLDVPPARERLAEAALAYARRQGAQLDRAMAALEPLLP
ncbi:3-deoxy-D-manno-octulosonic acid transferase [Phenylobacterium sp. J426]|uniref:3-deoxy-D-manno-octulosonic acid transferase n=1 Tax=Phenylobacterium sp. J426 TaxID=2898439 RepID=UPI002151C75E|nr:3-deoxy-D-manno-octulosonic acid transferase [Phenylobacterium sp. J426]MCR5873366.1 3-deoxy-D-manno-octulosonic acid transferase [Phenylobacterium sp. J426]